MQLEDPSHTSVMNRMPAIKSTTMIPMCHPPSSGSLLLLRMEIKMRAIF